MKTQPLFDFQRRVNDFADCRPRVGIFVFYGGGKTYMSLKWLETLVQPFPVLILTLKSLVHQWGCEVEKHTDLYYAKVSGAAVKRVCALRLKSDIYIVNYDAVRSLPVRQALAAQKFRTVIVDESTFLKEPRTARFKLLRKLTRGIPYRAILTAKPVLEDPKDAWAQMLFLDDGQALGTSFWKFRYEFFAPGPPWRPYDWDLKIGAAEEIGRRLSRNCIQVKKDEIEGELPPKSFVPVHFEMPRKLRKLYQQLKKDFQIELPSGQSFDTQWAMVRSAKMHQLCQGFMYVKGGDDYEELDNTKLMWLEENLALMLGEGPILIWTNFKAMLERISDLLTNMGISHEIYHGGLRASVRDAAVAKFMEGEVAVLVLTEQAGAYGLNLQRANQAIFVSTDYKAALRENAIDRCHRIGSEIHKNVTYYDLIFENSIDEVVLKAITRKLNIAEEILQHIREE